MSINIFESFKYCLWIKPENNHEWQDYCIGFCPHMSIKTNINFEDLNKYNYILSDKCNLNVNLVGELYQTKLNNFYALQYNIELDTDRDQTPLWWPENPHISFGYKYNSPFSKKDIKDLENIIKIRSACLNNICFQNCNGHFNKWEIVA